MPPHTSADFDKAYGLPFTFWGDIRIPKEIVALVDERRPARALELGCGVGRFSRYVAEQGVTTTGVDFSPVAIGKARATAAKEGNRAEFLVSDVTELAGIRGPFDVAFDVGCFHCLDAERQGRYAAAVSRVLAPGGIHLVWALDHSPSDLTLSPDVVRSAFAPEFELLEARRNRRRVIASHWYWLRKAS